MSDPTIPREVLDKASKISPEMFASMSMHMSRLTRAFAATGLPTDATQARRGLNQAADILAEDSSQAKVVQALRTAAQNFSDDDALRFCRDATSKFSNQAEALRKTLEVVATHKGQSQKKRWWKFW